MKLSTKQLKQIIKEELEVLLEDAESGDEYAYRFSVSTRPSWGDDVRPDDWTEKDESETIKAISRGSSEGQLKCEDMYRTYERLERASRFPLESGDYYDNTIVDENGDPVGRTIPEKKFFRKMDYIYNLGRKHQCKWAFSDDEWEQAADMQTAGDPAPKRDDK